MKAERSAACSVAERMLLPLAAPRALVAPPMPPYVARLAVDEAPYVDANHSLTWCIR
jgi:hypothetical protein